MKKAAIACILACVFPMLFAEPMELVGGKLKLILYPETGSFSLYQLSDVGKNRYEPLYEDRNNSATSWFSVSLNGRIFKLAKKSGKPVITEPTTDGARFIFTLTDDFQVVQEFSFVNAPSTATPCAVRLVTTIENTSGKQAAFALKGLYDTMLGESEGIHFVTNIRNRISSETRIESGIDPDTVIVSKKPDEMLMFLVEGFGVTRPDTVYIANWDRLNTLTWVPDFVEGRSFNTLYSVNDSALLFVWPERILQPKDKLAVTMVFGEYTATMVSRPHAAAPIADIPATVAQPAGKRGKNSGQQVMVEQLLERIAEIEANPASASDDELKNLNQQLDSMLEKIKE